MKKWRLIEKCALGAFVCLFLFEALSFQSGCGEIRTRAYPGSAG